MSLVAYGSSDESSEDEENNCETNTTSPCTSRTTVKETNEKLCLPPPRHDTDISTINRDNNKIDISSTDDCADKIHFDKLPKPKNISTEPVNIIEEEDIPPRKDILESEKPIKKDRVPVKITVPSLSEFKDVEEENAKKQNKIMPSDKGTKLFSLLPPPKGADVKKTTTFIPHVLTKPSNKINQAKDSNSNKVMKSVTSKKPLNLLNYDSNSEDEDDATSKGSSHSATDFFALTATESVPNTVVTDTLSNEIQVNERLANTNRVVVNNLVESNIRQEYSTNSSVPIVGESSLHRTLISNVMNLPREDIILKNKAEVGPKLPVPEQEYNVDEEGNVAFDEKAIEYLCGKRGIKRKNKELDEANIIEINAEDIKPDEREWLVKALTEAPVQRPVSMQGGGVNSQSKKKHQITYLAHQAKAMEMELKNQWAQNRMTRKQTQSKYGF